MHIGITNSARRHCTNGGNADTISSRAETNDSTKNGHHRLCRSRKAPPAITSINCNLFTGKVNIKIESHNKFDVFQLNSVQFWYFSLFFIIFHRRGAHTFVVRMHFTGVHCRCTFCAVNESIGRWCCTSTANTITIILNGCIVTVRHFETFAAARKAPFEFNVGRIGIHAAWNRYRFFNGSANNCNTRCSAHGRICKQKKKKMEMKRDVVRSGEWVGGSCCKET